VRIEDSEVPLGVIATDIGTGDRVLLDHGRVATAVRASCCVPGLYQPVEIDGRLLVDGSLVENVPARAVRELGAPLVVAVSLGFELPFEPPGSWVQALANALDIAINSQMHYEIPAEADVLIDPDLGGLSQVRTRDSVAILEAGRHRAEEAMPVLRELLRRNEGNAVSRWVKSVKKRMRRKGA